MSRYPTKAELINVVKDTIVTDHNNLGTPKTLKAFNLTGILRDLDIVGDRTYGWTMMACSEAEFTTAILNNLRPSWKHLQTRWATDHPHLTPADAWDHLNGTTCTCCNTTYPPQTCTHENFTWLSGEPDTTITLNGTTAVQCNDCGTYGHIA